MKASTSQKQNFRVLLVQNETIWDNFDLNFERVKALLSKAKINRVDLVCFHEYFLGEWKDQKQFVKAVDFFKLFCRKNSVNMVMGSITEKKRNKQFNTSFLVNREGKIIGRYRKIHVAVHEPQIAEGKEIAIFFVQGIKIGIGLCWDLWFPEYWRILREDGAKIFVVPAYIDEGRWDVFLSIAKTRALENQTFLILCNGLGDEGCGNSCIIGYGGEILCSLKRREKVLQYDLKLNELEEWRSKFYYKKRTDIYEVVKK